MLRRLSVPPVKRRSPRSTQPCAAAPSLTRGGCLHPHSHGHRSRCVERGGGPAPVEFGIQFFPDVGPDETPAQQYWNESLRLAEIGDSLGFGHVRTVEHYFHPYGGYSTNPIVFLAAASQ